MLVMYGIPVTSFHNCASWWGASVLFLFHEQRVGLNSHAVKPAKSEFYSICLSVKQQWKWSLQQKAFPSPYQKRISWRRQGAAAFFYDSDSISCLFSWCHLMTLTWGNIHLGQTSRRRSCASLEKVRIVRSADKGAQWISMISHLPPLWCAFWRCRSTTRDESSTAWSHATGR